MSNKLKTYQVWLENRQHLMNIEGRNETDARENFNDDIRFVEEKKDEGGSQND